MGTIVRSLKALGAKMTGQNISGSTIRKVLDGITDKYTGGSGGEFEILVTRRGGSDPDTADKTLDEIKSAYESGLSPVCALVWSGDDRNKCDRFPLVQTSPSFYKFGGCRVGSESWLEAVFIDINSDNSVDIVFTELYSAE